MPSNLIFIYIYSVIQGLAGQNLVNFLLEPNYRQPISKTARKADLYVITHLITRLGYKSASPKIITNIATYKSFKCAFAESKL